MGATDWTFLNSGLSAGNVARGVTTSPTPPSGGGSFCYGFNSMAEVTGAVALTLDAVANPDFAPIQTGSGTPPSAGGASIRGAIKRGLSAQKTGFSPFFFLGLQASGVPAVTDRGYIIGLEDSDPYRIVVYKGQIINGCPAASTTNSLMRSTASYAIPSDIDEGWHHIRFDMVVNLSGDVILHGFENDLASHPVTAAVWVPIPGCEQFIDDALGVNSGSLPYTEGYAGFGFSCAQMGRRGYVDYIRIARQLA